MFIGHEPILRFFTIAREEKRLAQVYCLAGPDQVGKRTLARFLASQLLNIDVSRLENHPDFTYLERLEDEKTGKLKKDVSISQARALREKLQRRSWMGGYNVVIINEAETLNEESSNALLKTLEEPSLTTIIFLITNNDAALLPTIRSRSQMLYFSLVSDQVLRQGLIDRGFEKDLIEAVLPLAVGRPGLALHLLEDETTRREYYEELTRFRSLVQSPFYAKVKVLETFFKDKDEGGERQRDRLCNVLDVWLLAWRTLLLGKLGFHHESNAFTQALVGVEYPAESIVANMRKVIEAKALLRYNVNQRLIMENCVIAF